MLLSFIWGGGGKGSCRKSFLNHYQACGIRQDLLSSKLLGMAVCSVKVSRVWFCSAECWTKLMTMFLVNCNCSPWTSENRLFYTFFLVLVLMSRHLHVYCTVTIVMCPHPCFVSWSMSWYYRKHFVEYMYVHVISVVE